MEAVDALPLLRVAPGEQILDRLQLVVNVCSD
jgi:hypothetical protein